MIHDEKTTEIEIPGLKPTSNIVHVNFHGTKRPSQQRADARPTTPVSPTNRSASVVPFQARRAFDLHTPWLVRVLALLSILFLSLLVL